MDYQRKLLEAGAALAELQANVVTVNETLQTAQRLAEPGQGQTQAPLPGDH